MKNIGEGISVVDIEKANGRELMCLFGELIYRGKFGEEHIDLPDNDVVLYQAVWDEMEYRLNMLSNLRNLK